jgi:hypothetical protein
MQGRRSLVAALVSVVVVMLVSASSVLAGGGGNSPNAKSCYKLGWKGLVTTTGASFASQDACVSYAATGGVLKRPQTISFTSTTPSPVTVGGSYTPSATTTATGLSVTVTLDATSSGSRQIAGWDRGYPGGSPRPRSASSPPCRPQSVTSRATMVTRKT